MWKQKHEAEEEVIYGDGKGWIRRNLIQEGSSSSVYLASATRNCNRYTQYFSPRRHGGTEKFLPDQFLMVKSVEFSDSVPLQKERVILDRLGGCDYILKCYGDEITTNVGSHGQFQMVYNLLIEYGCGGTLADLIKKSGKGGLPESDVRVYTKCVLLGLDYTHRLSGGIVHRNLAPENIMLVPSGNSRTGYVAKIGDYGCAKLVRNVEKLRLLEPYLRGRIRYLSPEAVADCIQGRASDVWALGCIVVEMLTGKSIWEGKTNSEIEASLFAIRKGRKGVSDRIPVGISKEAEEFLNGCFAVKVDKRLTANELLSQPFVAGGILGETENKEEVLVSRCRTLPGCLKLAVSIVNRKRKSTKVTMKQVLTHLILFLREFSRRVIKYL